jgi:hypothetical protein
MIEVREGMKRTRRHHLNKVTGGDMESIDVHDLPDNEVEIIAAFVEFLRQRRQQRAPRAHPPAHVPAESPFASWPLGAKGTLSREEIYEHLE